MIVVESIKINLLITVLSLLKLYWTFFEKNVLLVTVDSLHKKLYLRY